MMCLMGAGEEPCMADYQRCSLKAMDRARRNKEKKEEEEEDSQAGVRV